MNSLEIFSIPGSDASLGTDSFDSDKFPTSRVISFVDECSKQRYGTTR